MDGERLTPFEAFDLAVTRAGSQSALARICGCSAANINQLLRAKSVLPSEYVLAVERATKVSRHDLRPDIYPANLQGCIPHSPDAEGAAAIGELATGAKPEWPISPDDADSSCERDEELQAERPAA